MVGAASVAVGHRYKEHELAACQGLTDYPLEELALVADAEDALLGEEDEYLQDGVVGYVYHPILLDVAVN